MRVKVCDALCGSGKTISCINMMNSDTEHRYIFITPYLTEVERIKNSCTGRGFVTPQKVYENQFSKLNDIPRLLEAGKNIVSTHALFSNYTDEIKEIIREKEYILVLDEVIDLFQPVDIDRGDVEFLKRNKIAREDGDSIIWEDGDYNGVAFNEVMRLSRSRDMINYDGSFYFWSLTADLFKCFSEVYVLTYMFEYQLLKYFFKVNDIHYELIGTTKKNGTYQFCPLKEMDRRKPLKNKIHIEDRHRFNKIGDENFSLSSGWFQRASQEPEQPLLEELKANLDKVFRHKVNGENKRMWTTLNRYRKDLKGKGYANDFITFNKRASNDFADRNNLAYCLNVYMMPWMKNYLLRIGVKQVNQDMWALSVLIQWLFRSAIRNGEDVWLYIPSGRMRWLLKEWLENIEKGEDLNELHYLPSNHFVINGTNIDLGRVTKNRKFDKDE